MQWPIRVCGTHKSAKGFAVDASIDQCTVGKMNCAKFGMATPTKASHTLVQMTRADSNMDECGMPDPSFAQDISQSMDQAHDSEPNCCQAMAMTSQTVESRRLSAVKQKGLTWWPTTCAGIV